jgi:hypothetical protein
VLALSARALAQPAPAPSPPPLPLPPLPVGTAEFPVAPPPAPTPSEATEPAAPAPSPAPTAPAPGPLPLPPLPLPPIPASTKPRAPAPPVTAKPPEPQYLDYRLQLVVSDAAAVGLVVGAFLVPGEEAPGILGLASLGTYLLVPPVIHAVNGQPMRGLGSLGARVGFPIVGVGVGLIAAAPLCSGDGDDWGCLGAVVGLGGLGLILGGVGAMVLDDAVLGKVELPRSEAKSASRHRPRVAVLPLADPKRKSLGLSVAGVF